MSRAAMALSLALALALPVGVALLRRERTTEPPERRLSLRQVMAPGSTEGFARALEPRELVFPADHGPHPEFQTEWWYFTGNLDAEDSLATRPQRFGYQMTFFRSALRPPVDSAETEGASSWRADQLYMAHFALTDADEGRFEAFERFSRGALDLAGVRVTPFRVWLENWSVASRDESFFPLSLRAADTAVALDLTIEAGRPLVLQGEAGLSRKGTTPGNASYYYSFTRLPTRGRIEIAGRAATVEGWSWLDREWSTSALEADLVGWDWFALQLSDGRDVMFYRLRRADGSIDPFSSGTIVEADGSYRRIDPAQVELVEASYWRSPETGATYPARWRLTSVAAGIDLEIEPLVASQEHSGTILYWEGAVEVAGSSRGAEVRGRGYVELTGYEPGRHRP